jgi:hypothetical protein
MRYVAGDCGAHSEREKLIGKGRAAALGLKNTH